MPGFTLSLGGGCGYLGRFGADGRTVRAFATDRKSVALPEMGGTQFAQSPRAPERLVAEVGRGV